MIKYEQAIIIAKEFAEEVQNMLKDNLLAVFAIGSLGSDYYRPGQSDIDTIIITSLKRENLKIYRKDIRKLADSYQKKYDVPKGFGAILLAKEQLYPPYKYDEELILEIYRIKKQSKLVYVIMILEQFHFLVKRMLFKMLQHLKIGDKKNIKIILTSK